MGRKSLFNRQQVLDDSLDLFWSRSFYATSLKQLEEITEMHPGSLYYHFQNKEQLYLEVLEHYLQWHFQPRIHKYLFYGSDIVGLRRFFSCGYRYDQHQIYRNCCFLVNSGSELHLLPKGAAATVQNGVQLLRDGLNIYLNKIVKSGNLQLTEGGMNKTVSGLINLYFSLQLMAKIDPNQHRLDKQVNLSISNLINN